LIESKNTLRPYSFSPDGRRLSFHALSPGTSGDILTLPLDLSDPEHPKAGQPEVFLRTPAVERYGAFSPDGRWMAYQSGESGADEIYVRPFPGPGGRWQISTGGGQFPIWSRNGREIFFESLDNRIMVADYSARGESFEAGKPRIWSNQNLLNTGIFPNLDLAPDGKRFVVLPGDTGETKSSVHVTFLLNFFDELRRKAPVK
jgi:serine/threonine-protein kinase